MYLSERQNTHFNVLKRIRL